jgi:hypothetical protein
MGYFRFHLSKDWEEWQWLFARFWSSQILEIPSSQKPLPRLDPRPSAAIGLPASDLRAKNSLSPLGTGSALPGGAEQEILAQTPEGNLAMGWIRRFWGKGEGMIRGNGIPFWILIGSRSRQCGTDIRLSSPAPSSTFSEPQFRSFETVIRISAYFTDIAMGSWILIYRSTRHRPAISVVHLTCLRSDRNHLSRMRTPK